MKQYIFSYSLDHCRISEGSCTMYQLQLVSVCVCFA